MTIANYLETKLLDLVFNATAYAGQATVYAKVHLGDPGENCTANPAVHTTRAPVSMGAASGGGIVNDADISYSALAATETYSHVSLWDALTGGNPLWYGPLTAPVAVTVGGVFVIPVGNLTITLD